MRPGTNGEEDVDDALVARALAGIAEECTGHSRELPAEVLRMFRTPRFEPAEGRIQPEPDGSVLVTVRMILRSEKAPRTVEQAVADRIAESLPGYKFSTPEHPRARRVREAIQKPTPKAAKASKPEPTPRDVSILTPKALPRAAELCQCTGGKCAGFGLPACRELQPRPKLPDSVPNGAEGIDTSQPYPPLKELAALIRRWGFTLPVCAGERECKCQGLEKRAVFHLGKLTIRCKMGREHAYAVAEKYERGIRALRSDGSTKAWADPKPAAWRDMRRPRGSDEALRLLEMESPE